MVSWKVLASRILDDAGYGKVFLKQVGMCLLGTFLIAILMRMVYNTALSQLFDLGLHFVIIALPRTEIYPLHNIIHSNNSWCE